MGELGPDSPSMFCSSCCSIGDRGPWGRKGMTGEWPLGDATAAARLKCGASSEASLDEKVLSPDDGFSPSAFVFGENSVGNGGREPMVRTGPTLAMRFSFGLFQSQFKLTRRRGNWTIRGQRGRCLCFVRNGNRWRSGPICRLVSFQSVALSSASNFKP